jgi:HK97 family phage major capsid protein
MRELLPLIKAKQAEVDQYLTDGEGKDIAKAAAAQDEVDNLVKEYELLERQEKAGKASVGEGQDNGTAADLKALADAARAGFRGKDLNEGTGANGGYTVPEDIVTRVERYKEARFSLGSHIDHEPVSTNSGRRTYQKRAQHVGFTEVAEGGKITKVAAPEFDILSYTIKKFAGYLPVTNELLDDSDANIANTIIEWLGEEELATDNAKVIALVNTLAAATLTGIKDIKKALNVTLALFKDTSKVYTNADGLNYLDTLEDGNKRFLLTPDPNKPMEAFLSVGTRRVPLVVIPNEVLPTAEGGKVPFWMGDLHAFAKKFNRKQLTLTVSDTAAVGELNAYEQDLTLFRAIERMDYVTKDNKAMVRGELTLPTA